MPRSGHTTRPLWLLMICHHVTARATKRIEMMNGRLSMMRLFYCFLDIK